MDFPTTLSLCPCLSHVLIGHLVFPSLIWEGQNSSTSFISPFNLLFLCDSSSGSVLTCPDAQRSQQTHSELLFPATCRASPWGRLRFPTGGHCCNPCVCSSRLSHLTQRHRDSTQVRHQKVILLSVCSPTASMTSSDSRPPRPHLCPLPATLWFQVSTPSS